MAFGVVQCHITWHSIKLHCFLDNSQYSTYICQTSLRFISTCRLKRHMVLFSWLFIIQPSRGVPPIQPLLRNCRLWISWLPRWISIGTSKLQVHQGRKMLRFSFCKVLVAKLRSFSPRRKNKNTHHRTNQAWRSMKLKQGGFSEWKADGTPKRWISSIRNSELSQDTGNVENFESTLKFDPSHRLTVLTKQHCSWRFFSTAYGGIKTEFHYSCLFESCRG